MARPGKPWAHAIAAIPIDAPRVHPREQGPGRCFILGADARREAIAGVVHQVNTPPERGLAPTALPKKTLNDVAGPCVC